MTVDVEDYFQVSAFAGSLSSRDWDSYPHRVVRNTDAVLALFDGAGVVGTFFILGWVAERYPSLVRSIAESGHEIASHGYAHERVGSQSPQEFREDVSRARQVLQDVSGTPVPGYRAASFSLDPSMRWAYDILAAEGHTYSSSVYPVRHDHYGTPDAPRVPFLPCPGVPIIEIPLTTIRLRQRNFPCAGGGYFRLLPYRLSAAAIRRVHASDRSPCIFYFHPWEIDPGQPHIRHAAPRSRLRHYANLRRMHGKLKKLLKDFRWNRLDHVYDVQRGMA
ncbi:MAG: XrtA system polysaccharide deacetylase [Burkholderiales bacterium]